MFSTRVPASLAPNALTSALARVRARGVSPLDLTGTNPTHAGIEYPDGLLDALSWPAASVYDPDPAGTRPAREFLAGVLATLGPAPDPGDLFLTASTSEAYGVLFKLLCDAGDAVLVPQPSYPLFEHLAALENVAVAPYALAAHWNWGVDVGALEAAWTPRTRAVVVVSPNNPTGSLVRRDERRALLEWGARRGVAVIVDEVFRWYTLDPPADAVSPFLDGEDVPGLVFALDGLSKSCGLPQVKLAWMQVAGDRAVVDDARRRLELILDTYLSVNTPVQVALPELWRRAEPVRRAIANRVRENLSRARQAVGAASGCDLVRPDGGWSAAIRVPAVVPEDRLVIELLERDEVLVHPGYFFDFPREAYLVVSLLPRPDVFAEGVARVVGRCRIA